MTSKTTIHSKLRVFFGALVFGALVLAFFNLCLATASADDAAKAEPKAAEPNPPVVTAEETPPANEEAAPPAAPPATPLFDGNSLNGWQGYLNESPTGWSVVDGVMAFSGKGEDLITTGQFEHFELELEFKTEVNTNSGILYRVRKGDRAPYMSGPEFQIMTAVDAKPGNPLNSTAALYALYPSQPGLEKPAGEWNTAKILVQGEHIEHWLNGTKVVDCDLASEEAKQKLAKSKFNGWPQFNKTKKGHIGLQSHGHPVWFRKVTIRELPAPAAKEPPAKPAPAKAK